MMRVTKEVRAWPSLTPCDPHLRGLGLVWSGRSIPNRAGNPPTDVRYAGREQGAAILMSRESVERPDGKVHPKRESLASRMQSAVDRGQCLWVEDEEEVRHHPYP